MGTRELDGGWVPVVGAELDRQEKGGMAVLAQAALFIIPRHLELGLNPPNSLDWSDTFVFSGHCSQRPLSRSDGQPGQKPSALGWSRGLPRPRGRRGQHTEGVSRLCLDLSFRLNCLQARDP